MTYKTVKRNTWLDCYEQVGDSPLMNLRGLTQVVPVDLMRFLCSCEHYEAFTKSAQNRPTQRIFVRRSGEAKVAQAAKAWAAMERQRCRS